GYIRGRRIGRQGKFRTKTQQVSVEYERKLDSKQRKLLDGGLTHKAQGKIFLQGPVEFLPRHGTIRVPEESVFAGRVRDNAAEGFGERFMLMLQHVWGSEFSSVEFRL